MRQLKLTVLFGGVLIWTSVLAGRPMTAQEEAQFDAQSAARDCRDIPKKVEKIVPEVRRLLEKDALSQEEQSNLFRLLRASDYFFDGEIAEMIARRITFTYENAFDADDRYPCENALIRMGTSGLAAVTKVLANNDDPLTVWMCRRVVRAFGASVYCIVDPVTDPDRGRRWGDAFGNAYFNGLVSVTKDPTQRQRLQKSADYFAKRLAEPKFRYPDFYEEMNVPNPATRPAATQPATGN